MNLTISPNKRHLHLDGKPFFWLGDTAWLLLAKLTYEEALTYLDNRAEKGYNVIQITLIHSANYRTVGGSPALIDEDFSRPNPDMAPDAFWPFARRVVDAAAERGLMVALLPSWGSFVSGGHLSGDKVDVYVDFLTERFGDCKNVLWLVGGDVRGNAAEEDFNRIGNRLRKNLPNHRVGFHPFGRTSSSQWFNDAPWLDFHMFQSGHRRYDQIKMNEWDDKVDAETFVGEDSYRYVQHDRALEPVRPVLDGEPSYELIPHGLHDGTQPYWQTCDVRRYAYWSMMAGACGFTYGSNSIMQFWNGEGPGAFFPVETWQEALHNPGSMQMTHFRRFFEEIGWQDGEPAQDYLVDNTGVKYDYNLALRTPKALSVYTYTGKPFRVNTAKLGSVVRAWWFDVTSGGKSIMCLPAQGEDVLFTPPNRRCGQNDWVLVLETN